MSPSRAAANHVDSQHSGSESDDVDIREDSDGWNDIDDDVEELDIKCLLCNEKFPALTPLLEHQLAQHEFDLAAIKQKHDLDFYGLIKLVNYVRSSVAAGSKFPGIGDPSSWNDHKFLKPVLEDDPLITCLDDLDDSAPDGGGDMAEQSSKATTSLEAKKVQELEQQLSKLTEDFAAYRQQVAETLDRRWQSSDLNDQNGSSSVTRAQALAEHHAELDKKYDDGYFDSYAALGIHQTMLQDTVRTDAYRDFVYDNKHLFKDKTVLDVGCGTGILSMFAAKAGAKRVIAVDASSFMDRARGIAVANGLAKDVGGPIVFHKGKVEEITDDDALRLGLAKKSAKGSLLGHVDVLISEWMGYCLLFEAMLPSVLHARDRFLQRETDDENTFAGLMVPSHASIHIAPLSDPDWMIENVSFWHDVYGFDMSSLVSGAIEEVLVRMPPKEAIVASVQDQSNGSTEVKVFDLYKTTVADLDFTSAFQSKGRVDSQIDLDGFCIWFDICFSPQPARDLGQSSSHSSLTKLAKQAGAVYFSTSPFGKPTHWQTGCCVIDRSQRGEPVTDSIKLEHGDVLDCRLTFKKGEEGRDLEVTVEWDAIRRAGGSGAQLWKMR